LIILFVSNEIDGYSNTYLLFNLVSKINLSPKSHKSPLKSHDLPLKSHKYPPKSHELGSKSQKRKKKVSKCERIAKERAENEGCE